MGGGVDDAAVGAVEGGQGAGFEALAEVPGLGGGGWPRCAAGGAVRSWASPEGTKACFAAMGCRRVSIAHHRRLVGRVWASRLN